MRGAVYAELWKMGRLSTQMLQTEEQHGQGRAQAKHPGAKLLYAFFKLHSFCMLHYLFSPHDPLPSL